MTLRLPRLNSTDSITDDTQRPSFSFQRFWQSVVVAIEAAFNAQSDAIAAIAAAQTAADNANAAAATAQAAAASSSASSALASSGTSGLTLTAIDAGTDATIQISAHTRIYADGSSVAVSAGTVTGKSYSSTYYVYYSDPSRAGGSVSYQASLSSADAVQTGAIHSLGTVTTPAAAGGPSTGKRNLGPGVQEP
jgi:hypothetical protein